MHFIELMPVCEKEDEPRYLIHLSEGVQSVYLRFDPWKGQVLEYFMNLIIYSSCFVYLFCQREKRLNQEQDHLKKQIQNLTEDVNKHTAELMTARREHTNMLLALQTQLSQSTEEVKIGC
jgi:C4-dicarboxylate-specific signal transduction histidine kinase